ncbi:MAG: hypothetical protein ACK5P5_04505 [Pseudobdellovibrionaceae bacterium]
MDLAKLFFTSLCCYFLFTYCSMNAYAADIWIWGESSYKAIVLEGEIVSGDFKKFENQIRENQGRIGVVYIFSSGGDFEEAMKIGRAMRLLELSSMVPMKGKDESPICNGENFTPDPKRKENCICASACFFIHIGGQHRGGNFLAVHRPYFSKGKFGQLSESESRKKFEQLQATAKDYMKEMGVPQSTIEDVVGTPSDKALILDEKTIKIYFWGSRPARHEWLLNKCSELGGYEKNELEVLSDKMSRAIELSADDINKYKKLDEKRSRSLNCTVEATKKLRLDAYKKYFGKAPSDIENYSFSVWENIWKSVGMSFDEVNSDSDYTETESVVYKDEKVSRLSKLLTNTQTKISMDDNGYVRRVVATVQISQVAPSKEFINQLERYLKKKWGNPKTEPQKLDKESLVKIWYIRENKYEARLKYYSKTADGGYLVLSLDKAYGKSK